MSRGIVLMNLGSPASTAVADVRRYLNEFLMDRHVLDFPYWKRLLLVRGIITPFRAPKSAHAYASIWTDQGSPLVVNTYKSAQALEALTGVPVAVAMRYGGPKPAEAYAELARRVPGLQEVVLVPLYPHHTKSSWITAVELAQEQHDPQRHGRLRVVQPFYNDEAYIGALCERIAPYLAQPHDRIVFSYHGIPERHVTERDPAGTHDLEHPDRCCTDAEVKRWCYRHHCLTTTQAIAARLGIARDRYEVTFQSRLGRERWLQPPTDMRLQQLPNEGAKHLLIISPAFVSDCLETLEELDMRGREDYLKAGGDSYTYIPCLNDHPAWIKALAALADRAFQDRKEGVLA